MNENKKKDLELLTLKINPELDLSLSMTFKKLKTLVKKKRGKLYQYFRDSNGQEYESLKSLVKNNETYVETDIDANKINQMKKEQADKADSFMSEVPAPVQTDTTHKTKVVVKQLGKVNLSHHLMFDSFVKTLQKFEFLSPKDEIKLIVLKLDCYNIQIGCVDFLKFLRQTYKYKDQIDMHTGRFKLMKSENEGFSAEKVKMRAIQLIQSKVKRFLESRQNQDNEADSKTAKLRMDIDLKVYTPEQMVKILREKLSKSKCNPKDIVKKFDLSNTKEVVEGEENEAEPEQNVSSSKPEVDKDQITFDTFKKIILEELKFNDLSKEFLDQVYRALDLQAKETISYQEFLTVLYDTKGAELLRVPTNGAKLVEIVRKASNFHFKSPSKFMKFCNHKHPSEITNDEFYVFLKSFTRLDRKSIDKVFLEFAVPKDGTDKTNNNKDISEMAIYESNLLKIYEDSNKSKSRVFSGKKSFEEEKFKSFMDLSGLNLSGFGGGGAGFNDAGRSSHVEEKPEMGGIDNDIYLQNDAPSEFSMDVDRGQVRHKKDQIEELILNISLCTLDQIKYQNKKTKDLFQMFADKLTRMMNFDEFSEAIKFICKDNTIEEDVLSGCYYLFAWPTCKKVTYSKFIQIVEMGKKMNPLYIKVKNRYVSSMEKYRNLYRDELLKMDVKDGEGYVTLIDIIRLFKINKIDISEMDCEFLKEEGIIVLRDKTNCVEINQFINKVFPKKSVFEEYVSHRSAGKLQNSWRKYKSREVVRERQDAFLELLMGGESFGGGSAKSVKKKGKGRKGKKKNSKLEEEEKEKIRKPAEIFEIAGGEKDKTHSLSSKKTLFGVKKRFKKKLTGRALAQAQMGNLLIPKKTSILSGANRQKVEAAVRSILNDVINQAVSYGESLKLTKKVQRRYAQRPITKDVFVLINENYLDVVDVIPSSLSVYRLIGRILWLTYGGVLKQYDVVNGKLLPDIGLVTRIPGKKTKIIDYMVDENSGNIYVLKENWDLELWDIF